MTHFTHYSCFLGAPSDLRAPLCKWKKPRFHLHQGRLLYKKTPVSPCPVCHVCMVQEKQKNSATREASSVRGLVDHQVSGSVELPSVVSDVFVTVVSDVFVTVVSEVFVTIVS